MYVNNYDDTFYQYVSGTSDDSAMVIAPLIFEVFRPASILDIGCGTGAWLRTFIDMYKLDDVRGVDGNYIKDSFRKIPKEKFTEYDLTNFYDAGRQFDMSLSVEVGEHLPDSSSDNLVKSLTNAAKCVVFSAAMPGQGGTYHINEQNPEYWAEKFAKHGYVCIDYLRPKIWDNEKVYWWYRQNILMFVHKDELAKYTVLHDAYQKTDPKFLRRIHKGMVQTRERDIARLKNPIANLRYHLYLAKQKIKGA
jgi:SAM-dependent methyltransferase